MEMPAKKLGYGMMRLPKLKIDGKITMDYETVNHLVDAFMERGFQYFDTAFPYCKGCSEEAIRRCLTERYDRDSFYLTNKMSAHMLQHPEEVEPKFQEQLKKCGVSYFDNYLVHNMGTENYKRAVEWGIFEWVQGLKERGLVKHIGFSFHDQPELLDRILTEHPEMEYVQLQINYSDWENPAIRSRECYEIAVKHGKKVIVMEPLKGGTLANVPESVQALLKSYHPDMSVASWGIRFAASLEHVVMVLSGMSTMEQVLDNAEYMTDFQPLTKEELAVIDQAMKVMCQSEDIPCTACGYCVEGCPKKIAIPEYFALYNADQRISAGFTSHVVYYGNYIKEHGKASDCIGCKKCEKSCPQHLQITEHLKKVAERFEK